MLDLTSSWVSHFRTPPAELVEVTRVLRPHAPVVLTFSNRCFPTKAVRGWLATDDAGHCAIVGAYLTLAGGFTKPDVTLRTPPPSCGDPLYAVVVRRL